MPENPLINIVRTICKLEDWILGEVWSPVEHCDYLNFSGEWHDATSDKVLKDFILSSKDKRFFKGVGLAGRVWESQKPEWIYDIQNVSCDRFVRSDEASQAGLRTAMGFPIVIDTVVSSVIVLFNDKPKPIDRKLIANLCGSFGNVEIGTDGNIEQAERLKQLTNFEISRVSEMIRLGKEVEELKSRLSKSKKII